MRPGGAYGALWRLAPFTAPIFGTLFCCAALGVEPTEGLPMYFYFPFLLLDEMLSVFEDNMRLWHVRLAQKAEPTIIMME